MRTICLYFQVHQPYRLRWYRFFDIGAEHYYYDDYLNKAIVRKVADNCYLPANKLLLDIIKENGDNFKITFSISGNALEQFEQYAPDVLASFQELAKTGCVEFLSETYTHSLSSLASKDEFIDQVNLHRQKIEQYFGQTPKVFRNTELIYSDWIGDTVAEMGYKAMLTEGAKHILGWKSPNFLYYNPLNPKLKLILKNYKLSDDIAFRFSNTHWIDWPLTAEKYAYWLNNLDVNEDTVNLFMDYETFGEHQKADSGIFHFLGSLPQTILSFTDFKFATPSELIEIHQPVAAMNVEYPISWADAERDLTAWIGNELQNEAFDKVFGLREMVLKTNNYEIIRDWRLLQTSDHFYYMCTKFFADGDVHKYFNPYKTPYDAFINYMNVLSDLIIRVKNELQMKADELLTENEIINRIRLYEQEISKLKARISPALNIIEKTKEENLAIEITKEENIAIEITKKEATPIEKTKREHTPIEKTKKEATPIEKTKKESIPIEKTKTEIEIVDKEELEKSIKVKPSRKKKED